MHASKPSPRSEDNHCSFRGRESNLHRGDVSQLFLDLERNEVVRKRLEEEQDRAISHTISVERGPPVLEVTTIQSDRVEGGSGLHKS